MNNQSNNSFPPSPPPNRRKFLEMVGYIGLGATIAFVSGKTFKAQSSSVTTAHNTKETNSDISLSNDILTFDLGNSIQLEMRKIPAGSFLMGSPLSDNQADPGEFPQHQVTINEFYVGKYQITQEQYQNIMGVNPSSFKKGGIYPVESVSWYDCQEFCQKISAKTGKIFRLPSEAQWEYACRAGTQTRYYFGDDGSQLGEYAWFFDNSGGETHQVGQKTPNSLGLYDMYGNLWEWCEDNAIYYYHNAPNDGSPWLTSSDDQTRIIRGGGWNDDISYCRSATRRRYFAPEVQDRIGFRVMLIS